MTVPSLDEQIKELQPMMSRNPNGGYSWRGRHGFRGIAWETGKKPHAPAKPHGQFVTSKDAKAAGWHSRRYRTAEEAIQASR